MSKLQIDFSFAELQQQELRRKLKESDGFLQKLRAQNTVLREALAGKQIHIQHEDLLIADQGASEKDLQLETSALQTMKKETESLRQEVERLTDVEGKLRKVETTNAELWQANKDLERQIAQKEMQNSSIPTDQMNPLSQADYDGRTTKIVHLLRGPLQGLEIPTIWNSSKPRGSWSDTRRPQRNMFPSLEKVFTISLVGKWKCEVTEAP